jgi:hypothetical protein
MDGKIGRQTERWTDKYTNRKMDRQRVGQTQIDKKICWTERQMDGKIGRQANRRKGK